MDVVGRTVEVLRVFLLLGLTSFGGPVAHLGYFREAFVQRRRWLDSASPCRPLSRSPSSATASSPMATRSAAVSCTG